MKHKQPQIVPIYDNYQQHIAARKIINSPYKVVYPKVNHPKSYYAEENVDAEYPFGHNTVECEVRQGAPYNYSFSYKSDVIDSNILVRLDTGDGTHNNKAPGIPLELSSVPTPHIHKYRKDGYAIANPIPGVDYSTEASTKFDYQQGFDYFCSHLNITDKDQQAPLFQYAPDGIMVFPVPDTDPNEDADFDNIL